MTPPAVTVAIPARNEARRLRACLDAVRAQDYDGDLETIVVDGCSSDATRDVAASAGVKVIENPARLQAAGLNRALEAATGEVFVRVDARSTIPPDYVRRCVEALDSTGAALVGGVMAPAGEQWLQRGVAAAMRSRLGVGGARFRGGPSGWVDTVYLGAMRAETARAVSGYAEDQATNEDAELAHRLRSRGGVWLIGDLAVRYEPREHLSDVWRQFHAYGRGRAATVRRHRVVSVRQLVAPAFLLALLLPGRRRTLAAYATFVLGRAAVEARRDAGAAAGLALAMPTIHFSWGSGFLRGLLTR